MSQPQDLLQNSSKKVFSKVKGNVFINGEKIQPELRKLLKEQAFYLSTSQLWETMIDTAEKEASNLALNESLNWDHVQYAKALKYWSDIFVIMVNTLKE